MTSEERREARYQRRRAKRAAAKTARNRTADNFSLVLSYGALYDAYRACRRNVTWKASVQKYITQAPVNVYRTWKRLQDGTYASPRFFEFDICERGKKRHIKSTIIGERVVQRALCDNSLVPALRRTFIHDNGACMTGKGYTFAVDRLCCHLQKFIRKHGPDGYILMCDLHSFFDSIMHWAVRKILHRQLTDLRLIGLSEELIRQFDPDTPAPYRRGLGLGSQISQVLAPAVASSMDHYIKTKLRVKYYGRYMDDFYLIDPDKATLRQYANQIDEVCRSLGLELSRKKTQIFKLRRGFTFLKIKIRITETGHIVKRIARSSVTRERRKLKKLYHKYLEGRITYTDAWNSFQSWTAHAKRFATWRTRINMEVLFARLFVGGNVLCCT